MPFDVHSFDVIIDKGTLDCIGCDDDDSKALKAVDEFVRVCKSGGYLLILSHSDLSSRQPWWDHISSLLSAIKCTPVKSVIVHPPPAPSVIAPAVTVTEAATSPVDDAVPLPHVAAPVVSAAATDPPVAKSETSEIPECYLYKLQKR